MKLHPDQLRETLDRPCGVRVADLGHEFWVLRNVIYLPEGHHRLALHIVFPRSRDAQAPEFALLFGRVEASKPIGSRHAESSVPAALLTLRDRLSYPPPRLKGRFLSKCRAHSVVPTLVCVLLSPTKLTWRPLGGQARGGSGRSGRTAARALAHRAPTRADRPTRR